MPNPGDMTRAMTDRRVTISQPYVLSQNNETSSAVQEASIHCEYFGEFVSPRDDCAQPFAYMYYPVIDTVDFISIAGNEKYPEAFEVKAFIISEFYWGSLFRDMLQEDDAAAIFLVLENTCSSESFSYRINGLDATYLGRGSLHEKKYDGMLVSSSMSDLILHSDGNSDFASLPVLIDSCEYIFRLYPSDEFRAGKCFSTTQIGDSDDKQ